MVAKQRQIAARGQIVMVGRDIGTVVLPDAGLKVFLVASAEERARRRWLEEQTRGGSRTLDEVLAEIRRRDQIDSTRPIAPLRPAEGAIVVDSTGLNPHEVVDEILRKAGYST
ncbi:MAG: (d)CMP kinase [Caldilineales bacterium]